MAYLKSVPVPSWLPTPRSGKSFKITLWLDPAVYFLLMQQSTELQAGKISVHKWLKKQLGLDDAREQVKAIDGRTGMAVVRHISTTRPERPRSSAKPTRTEKTLAAAARRRKQPRKVAA
jgi:hypothetical protein